MINEGMDDLDKTFKSCDESENDSLDEHERKYKTWCFTKAPNFWKYLRWISVG